MRNNPTWLFFDLDGTLADSIGTLYQAYLEFMGKLGLVGTAEEFATLNGPSLPEIVDILVSRHNIRCRSRTELLETLVSTVNHGYRTTVEPMAGADETLAQLHMMGYNLGLVTSGIKKVAEVFLEQQSWKDYFSFYVFGDDVARAKPAADIYLRALDKSGARPSEAIVIEDSPNGIRAARAAGLGVIRLISDTEDKLDDDLDVEASISGLGEIPVILAHPGKKGQK